MLKGREMPGEAGGEARSSGCGERRLGRHVTQPPRRRRALFHSPPASLPRVPTFHAHSPRDLPAAAAAASTPRVAAWWAEPTQSVFRLHPCLLRRRPAAPAPQRRALHRPRQPAGTRTGAWYRGFGCARGLWREDPWQRRRWPAALRAPASSPPRPHPARGAACAGSSRVALAAGGAARDLGAGAASSRLRGGRLTHRSLRPPAALPWPLPWPCRSRLRPVSIGLVPGRVSAPFRLCCAPPCRQQSPGASPRQPGPRRRPPGRAAAQA